MGVFRKRRVFRDDKPQRLLGSQSIVTAGFSAAVVVGATLAGSTSSTGAELTASVEVGFAPISEITLELSVNPSVVASATMTGRSVSRGSFSSAVTISATQRSDALFQAQLSTACTMTVGSIFTMDVAMPVVVSATLDPLPEASEFACPVVITATFPSGEVSGGTIEASASADVTVSSSFTADTGNAFSAPVEMTATFTGVRTTHYRTPLRRCYVVPRRDRRL